MDARLPRSRSAGHGFTRLAAFFVGAIWRFAVDPQKSAARLSEGNNEELLESLVKSLNR